METVTSPPDPLVRAALTSPGVTYGRRIPYAWVGR